MTVFNKIFNYKKSVKYHKLMVQFTFWKEVLKLAFTKFIYQKSIQIIILPEHIGDVIAFTPFAEKLKIQNKNNYIVWLIKPSYLPIIRNNPNINYCIPIFCDGVAEKFSNTKYFKIHDVRFNGNNFCPVCQTARKYQKIDSNFNLDNYYEYGSLLEIFSKIAGDPLKKEDWFPKIKIPNSTEIIIDKLNLPAKYICIHTTSNDPNREWNNGKWKGLISKIYENTNLKIIQVGLIDDLKIDNPKFIDLCGKLSLIETAEVIKRSQLFIGIDSGPAHMANATQVKSIILLGKYRDITNYMPFSGNFANGINSKIIYNPKIICSEIEVKTVFDELQLLLNIDD